MACVQLEFKNIFPIVKHHIALIERYEDKYHRDFSLTFIKTEKDKSTEVIELLSKILRNSDIIFVNKTNIVIFSPGADWNISYDILNGVRDFFGIKDNKDAIVTYPDDGENTLNLLSNFSKTIYKNYDITINFISG